MNNVIIFGANGFTGKHFQRFFSEHTLVHRYNFIGIDRIFDPLDKNMPSVLRERLVVSPLNAQTITKVLDHYSPVYIINCIGTFGHDDFQKLLSTNAEITRLLLEAIVTKPILLKGVLLIGSAAEYGDAESYPISELAPLAPINLYGLSKVVQTHYALYYHRIFNIPVKIARTFNIVGAGLSPTLSISSFVEKIKAAKQGDTLPVKDLHSSRDYLDINDVISAYWKILCEGEAGQVYNVCSGKAYRMRDILHSLVRYSGKSLNIKEQSDKSNRLISQSYGNNNKLKTELGWNPKINIFDTLRSMIQYK